MCVIFYIYFPLFCSSVWDSKHVFILCFNFCECLTDEDHTLNFAWQWSAYFDVFGDIIPEALGIYALVCRIAFFIINVIIFLKLLLFPFYVCFLHLLCIFNKQVCVSVWYLSCLSMCKV